MSNAVADRNAVIDFDGHRGYESFSKASIDAAQKHTADMLQSYEIPVTVPDYVLRIYIENLAERLHHDTVALSNPRKIIEHPAFSAIQSLGKRAIPIICERLDSEPIVWLTVLPILVGSSPVSKSHQGRIQQMLQDWKDWAHGKGYLNTTER